MIRICLILVLVSGGFLLSSRNLKKLVRTYQFQSFLLVVIAICLGVRADNMVLLFVAALTLISKVIGIPACISYIQKRMCIQQDLKFSYLKPPGALMLSTCIILLVYLCFGRILKTLYSANSLFFVGAVVGVSLVLMGLIAVCTRKMAISKVMGYLSMENGVLAFGLFVTELPFFIEFVIIIDLIIVVLLTSIMTIGIDSSIEDYKSRMQEFHLWSDEGGIS